MAFAPRSRPPPLSPTINQIVALTVVVIIVLWGFAWIFHAQYSHLTEFSNMTTSMISLICIMCGSLDPSDIFVGYGKGYKQEGQLLSASFIFVNSFILLNIFISIMCTQYEEAQKIYGFQWVNWKLLRQLRRQVTVRLRQMHIMPAKKKKPPRPDHVITPKQSAERKSAEEKALKRARPTMPPHVAREAENTNKMVLALAHMLDETHQKMGAQDEKLKLLSQSLVDCNRRLGRIK